MLSENACGAVQMCHAHTKRKHYSQEQALEWMIQIAKGLRYLHTAKPKVLPPLSSLSLSYHSHQKLTGRGTCVVLTLPIPAWHAAARHQAV